MQHAYSAHSASSLKNKEKSAGKSNSNSSGLEDVKESSNESFIKSCTQHRAQRWDGDLTHWVLKVYLLPN